jgi:hypothetical protein
MCSIMSNRFWYKKFIYITNIAQRKIANIIITILDIIHRPVFYLKLKVSETGFCVRLQVEPIPFCPLERASSRGDRG